MTAPNVIAVSKESSRAMKWGWGIGLILGLLLSAPLRASDIDIPGLLLNETRTFAGNQFFTAFASAWQAYDPNGIYSLVMRERPTGRTVSQISVLRDGVVLFQRYIGISARAAERAGRDASAAVYQSLMTSELERQLVDPDLGADEFR